MAGVTQGTLVTTGLRVSVRPHVIVASTTTTTDTLAALTFVSPQSVSRLLTWGTPDDNHTDVTGVRGLRLATQ